LGKLERGLVQVYTGNGKGKTSAAFGLALRAVGRGLKVYVIQFIKGGFDYGELHVADRIPNLTLRAFGRGKFITARPPEREDVSLAEQALQLAKEVVCNGQSDVVILDEVNVAVQLKLISLEEVMNLIRSKPLNVELVLTGRHAADEVIKAADLVTEMREVKHPFREGHESRRGIDY
jgi:cob(I)alamin adenosyltransferase